RGEGETFRQRMVAAERQRERIGHSSCKSLLSVVFALTPGRALPKTHDAEDVVVMSVHDKPDADCCRCRCCAIACAGRPDACRIMQKKTVPCQEQGTVFCGCIFAYRFTSCARGALPAWRDCRRSPCCTSAA